MEDEIKRLKENSGAASVETALGQVRALALRASTHNSALVAALETLADIASANNHKEQDHFKMILKAARENEYVGPLHTLITKLLGTDVAKKVSSGLETWRKSVLKEGGLAGNQHHWGYPGPGAYGGPPPPWFMGPMAGRGRGARGRGRHSGPPKPKACFNCKALDHFAIHCPKAPQANN